MTDKTQARLPVTPEDYALVDEIRRYFGHIGQCSAALGPSYTPVQIVARYRKSKATPADGFRDAVIGWREYDWPEGFCRRTADLIAENAERVAALPSHQGAE